MINLKLRINNLFTIDTLAGSRNVTLAIVSQFYNPNSELVKVAEDDIFPWDPNNSDGQGYTLAWRYDLNKHWQVGLEQHINKNSADIRATLGQNVEINQQQSLAVLQYRW